MYESRREKPIAFRHFLRRLGTHFAAATGLLALFLGVGMLGYNRLEDLSWTDSFLNSAMLLGGMGPINIPQTHAGKLFAGGYALAAGLVFIVAAGVLLTPVLHRMFHTLHWDR